MILGDIPFCEMAEVLEMQLNKKLHLGNIKQKQIKEVIKTATQKERLKRFQSAAEFRVAVDRLVSLEYPEKSTYFKIPGIILGSATVLAAVIICIVSFGKREDNKFVNETHEIIPENIVEDTTDSSETIIAEPAQAHKNTYSQAVKLLSNKDNATEGLEMLKNLAADKDYNSVFLLSRLYFNSSESVKIGPFADSVALFRANLDMPEQNKTAHELLKKAISINSEDYKALFELGCDFKSKKRGATFDIDSAYFYLNKAKQAAIKTGAQRI